VERALLSGPDALTPAERRALLGDAEALEMLWHAMRTGPVHPGWTAGTAGVGRATIGVLRGESVVRPRRLATALPAG
jgi:hypothetical protein